jgi:hypothetical protein
MTPEIAEMAPCTMCPTRKENVEVADGETLWTDFICGDTDHMI